MHSYDFSRKMNQPIRFQRGDKLSFLGTVNYIAFTKHQTPKSWITSHTASLHIASSVVLGKPRTPYKEWKWKRSYFILLQAVPYTSWGSWGYTISLEMYWSVEPTLSVWIRNNQIAWTVGDWNSWHWLLTLHCRRRPKNNPKHWTTCETSSLIGHMINAFGVTSTCINLKTKKW